MCITYASVEHLKPRNGQEAPEIPPAVSLRGPCLMQEHIR